jgi:hypothetical protein
MRDSVDLSHEVHVTRQIWSMWSLCLHVPLDGLLLSWALEADRKTKLAAWDFAITEIADGLLKRYQKVDKSVLGEV